MNATFLYWFLNVLTSNLRVSRGGLLIIDGNPKGYEVSEHIDTKFEVNPRMLSTLKKAKSIWSMKPEANFETSVVGLLVILVALSKRQIWQGYSKSGRFSGRPSMSHFLVICFSLVIETLPKRWWIIWEIVLLKVHRQLGKQYSCIFEGWIWQFLFEDSKYCLESTRVISMKNCEGQQSHNVQEFQT